MCPKALSLNLDPTKYVNTIYTQNTALKHKVGNTHWKHHIPPLLTREEDAWKSTVGEAIITGEKEDLVVW